MKTLQLKHKLTRRLFGEAKRNKAKPDPKAPNSDHWYRPKRNG